MILRSCNPYLNHFSRSINHTPLRGGVCIGSQDPLVAAFMKRSLDEQHPPVAEHTGSRKQARVPTTPSEYGLQQEHVHTLANRLGVDRRVTLAETLAYCAMRRQQRGESLLRTDLVEAWDALPDFILSKDDANKEARLLILGLNIRKPTVTTVATHSLPNLTRLISTYVSAQCPNLTFTTLSLRLNADKGPHRDLGNSSDLGCIQVLTPETVGGNLWIADVKGDVSQLVHGSRVPGRIVDCHTSPYLNSIVSTPCMPLRNGLDPDDLF